MRNLMKLVGTSAVFAALCIGATNAYAVVLESEVSGHDANGPLYYSNQPFGFTSNTGPVSHTIAMPTGGLYGTGNGSGLIARSSHIGAASAAQQTLRSFADLRVDSLPTGVDASAKTYSHFRKEVVVGAGTSGLANGAPIRLNLALRLDGSATTGFINHGPLGAGIQLPLDYRLLTSADISFSYGVTDLDQLVWRGGIDGGPGGWVPLGVASLESLGRLRYDYQGSSAIDTLWSERQYSWTASSLVNGVLPGVLVNDYNDVASGIPGSTGYILDTGLLTLQIDTFVGNTLAIAGSMDIYLQAYADGGNTIAITASGLGDFGSTFDAELTSSVAGIVFEGELSGVYSPTAVPEAETWAMMLAGLGLIVLTTRRRKIS